MPTSATGTWKAEAGFTLLELMVVLVLIGIITSLAVLSAPGKSAEDLLREEGRRLSALLELNRQEAMLRSETRALRVSRTGYDFMLLGRDGQWQTLADDKLLRPRQWPQDIAPELAVEGRPVTLELEAEGQPQVLLSPDGELTEFGLVLSHEGFRADSPDYRLRGDALGRLELAPLP